jgi:hypothetical protein
VYSFDTITFVWAVSAGIIGIIVMALLNRNNGKGSESNGSSAGIAQILEAWANLLVEVSIPIIAMILCSSVLLDRMNGRDADGATIGVLVLVVTKILEMMSRKVGPPKEHVAQPKAKAVCDAS